MVSVPSATCTVAGMPAPVQAASRLAAR
jgi:hypothetical protein